MARAWRLRHKLVFGLALVLASIAVLVGGAMLALSSYADATQKTQQRLYLIRLTVILRDHILLIQSTNKDVTPNQEKWYIHDQLDMARKAIKAYREEREKAEYADANDPDDGRGDLLAMAAVEDSLNRFAAAVNQNRLRTNVKRLIEEEDIREPYDQLYKASTHLFSLLPGNIEAAINRAKKDEKRGLAVAGTATVVAVILVLTLLYYFRTWVFRPIRVLQAGVQRVHRGEFGQPIVLHSRDELEELANEFNAMTARLREVYGDLARQVNERSRQLVRSERMVSVGFLAAGVAHEINNPLASIAFCAEGLERRMADVMARVPKDDAEVLARYLKVIEQEAFRCKQITQKLLDFSRTGERKREDTDLGRLVQDVIDVARLLPAHKSKRIDFAPAYLVAAVSPPDVKSVVLNLVVNALDSMDDGGVLSVTLAAGGPPGREFAELTFRDTGCGMTADVLENIFEPFFTRRRTGNGTGLGLSISHQIIDQHAGGITAASPGPGRGSTFVVRLPLRPADGGRRTADGGSSALTPLPLPAPRNAA